MLLVALAWIYVVLMMAVAEATASNGSVLGAVFTFLLYGLIPLSLVLYILGTPARRRARRARELAEQVAPAASTPAPEPGAGLAVSASAAAPDGGGHPARDPVAPEREEP